MSIAHTLIVDSDFLVCEYYNITLFCEYYILAISIEFLDSTFKIYACKLSQ